MIALSASTSDGSSFGVYDDDKLIGYIHRQSTLTGDRYLASIHNHGQKKNNGKEFDSPNAALLWIEMNR